MNSKRLAQQLAQVALNRKVKVRRPSPAQVVLDCQSLYLSENELSGSAGREFFQDNKEDVEFLLSEEGKLCVTNILLEGITNYLKEYQRNM